MDSSEKRTPFVATAVLRNGGLSDGETAIEWNSPVPRRISDQPRFSPALDKRIIPPNQLRPLLSERLVSMMSFSQCIGIGLFLNAGRVIYLAGPGLGTIAYVLAGTVLWSSAACLGEMTALFPVKGPIIEFPRRFLDESLGYTAGWMTWFSWIVLVAAELVGVTHVFNFRYPPNLLADANYPDPVLQWAPAVSPAVIVLCFFVIMFLVNQLPVRQLGQLEFVFGTAKMLFIILLIVMNVGLAIQRNQEAPAPDGGNSGGRPGFWTYNTPYSFASQNITLPDGSVAQGGGAVLGAFWDAMTTCMFGMIGFETIAITAHENKDLRTEETIKIATRKICLRIITLYALATFTAGLNVPYTYPTIRDTEIISFGYGENSVFVAATVLAKLRTWPYVVNDFVIFSATTCGSNGIYNASRTLHAMASIPDAWPRWGWAQAVRRRLAKTSYGVPHAAVFVSSLFGLLGFLATSNQSQVILGRMVRTCVMFMIMTYALICASYLVFFWSIKAAADGSDENINNKDDPEVRQLYDRNSPQYPYRTHGQYLRASYALVGCILFILFNGWRSFVPSLSVGDFLACYICIPVVLLLFVLYQIKFWGWNPLRWQRKASLELQAPRPEIATSVPRRGVAQIDAEDLLTLGNLKALGRWLWVWVT